MCKNKFFLIVFFCLLCGITGSAQSLKEAETLFQEGEYRKSAEVYKHLLAKTPSDANLQLRLGRALLMNNEPEQALPYLEYAKNRRLARAERYLGDDYYMLYRFNDAKSAYSNYLSKLKDAKEREEVESLLARAELGEQYLDRVEDVAIIDSFVLPKNSFLKAYHLNKEYGEVLPLNQLFGSDFPDDQFAYMSGRKDRIILSYEGDSSKQTDLMISYRLGEDWTTAKVLSPVVNSAESENYPFMMPDGVMLYFASKGHEGLGGYDIFVSRYNSEGDNFSEPQNIGMPFNSPYNDYLLVIDEMAHVGWFVTDRFQPEGQVVVYEFAPNSEKILVQDLEPEEVLARAQLKSFRKAEGNGASSDSASEQVGEVIAASDSIYFVVNDNLIYRSTKEFVSEAALSLFQDAQGAEKRLNTLQVLLDGKRRELFVTEYKDDKASLTEAILSLEKDVRFYKTLEQEYLVRARKAEQVALIE